MRYSLSDSESSMLALGDEVTLVHYRLNAVLAALHDEGESTAGERGVLRNLIANGPMSVPQLAAVRPVSRQHIQRIVDRLIEQKLVDRIVNPAHRRSKLVRLTERGKERLAKFSIREAPLLEAAIQSVTEPHDVTVAIDLLRRLREHLDALLLDLDRKDLKL